MPKTAVQTPICDICGADVRAGSLFCYNCGGSLKEPASESVRTPPVPTSVSASKNGVQSTIQSKRREARKPRKLDRGPVQVVWEPQEGLSWIYVVAGIFLLLIAIILFVTASILK